MFVLSVSVCVCLRVPCLSVCPLVHVFVCLLVDHSKEDSNDLRVVRRELWRSCAP